MIVSTPQSVALIDTRKGVATFRKLGIPVGSCFPRVVIDSTHRYIRSLRYLRLQIYGAVLNMSYFHVPGTAETDRHYLFGPPTAFESTCVALDLEPLAQVPIESDVSTQGDRGTPVVLRGGQGPASASAAFHQLAEKVWARLQ